MGVPYHEQIVTLRRADGSLVRVVAVVKGLISHQFFHSRPELEAAMELLFHKIADIDNTVGMREDGGPDAFQVIASKMQTIIRNRIEHAVDIYGGNPAHAE